MSTHYSIRVVTFNLSKLAFIQFFFLSHIVTLEIVFVIAVLLALVQTLLLLFFKRNSLELFFTDAVSAKLQVGALRRFLRDSTHDQAGHFDEIGLRISGDPRAVNAWIILKHHAIERLGSAHVVRVCRALGRDGIEARL